MWRWREDLSQFAVMEKRLRAHNMSHLAVGDQGGQHDRCHGSLQFDWAIHMGGEVRGYYS